MKNFVKWNFSYSTLQHVTQKWLPILGNNDMLLPPNKQQIRYRFIYPMDEDNFKAELEKVANVVEKGLKAQLADDNETPLAILQAMRYASLNGGKRLRPFLVHATANLFSSEQQLVDATALAIECIHCYSLVHDDLPAMDNDELRRGQPSLWKHQGEATAILAGDALQSLAFELITHNASLTNAMIRTELIKGLAIASGKSGMVGGQIRDLAAESAKEPAQFADVIMIHAQKTGALIAYACEAGAIIGGAPPHERAALKLFGEKLGLAFQLKDDLLDEQGSASDLGKTPGKDAASGKATLVSALGQDKAQVFLDNLRDGALYALDPFGERAGMLRQIVSFVCERKN